MTIVLIGQTSPDTSSGLKQRDSNSSGFINLFDSSVHERE